MAAWLKAAVTALYYVSLPVIGILWAVFVLLRWLGSPFIYLGNWIWSVFVFPIHLLGRFEVLWKFLGWAILIGAITGIALRLCSIGIFNVLNLDRQREQRSANDLSFKGHTAATYRAARQQKKMQEQRRQALQAAWIAANPILGRGPSHDNSTENHGRKLSHKNKLDLMSTTILEETSSISSFDDVSFPP